MELQKFSETDLDSVISFFENLIKNRLIGELNSQEFDLTVIKARLDKIPMQSRLGVFLLDENKIVGAFIGVPSSYWHTPDDRYFNELIVFLLPQYRSKGNFKRLFEAVKTQCKEYNLKGITAGDSIQVNSRAYSILLKRNGFKESPRYNLTF